MDSIQAYVGKQHSMLPVGIRSCDIPYSHRDGKVRVPTSEFVCLFYASCPCNPRMLVIIFLHVNIHVTQLK